MIQKAFQWTQEGHSSLNRLALTLFLSGGLCYDLTDSYVPGVVQAREWPLPQNLFLHPYPFPVFSNGESREPGVHSLFLGYLECSIVNLSLPIRIQVRDTNFVIVQCVILAYLLTATALLINTGDWEFSKARS